MWIELYTRSLAPQGRGTLPRPLMGGEYLHWCFMWYNKYMDNNIKYCSVCGKPCGPSKGLEEAKVSHFQCAYDAAKGPREKLWKLLRNSHTEIPNPNS